jgi:hypothetical protein
MAMKSCKECKKEISTDAKQCPSCGKKNPTGGSSKLKIGLGIVAVLVVIRAASGGSSNTSTANASMANATTATTTVKTVAVPVVAMPVDNRKLWNDYEANEVAADATYKGKALKVSGVVASIDKDFMDNVVLRLASPNEFMSTMATMEHSETARSAALNKGQTVALLCTGKGRLMGSPALDDCRFP